MSKKEKNKNLQDALAKIEKQFGKGTIMKLGKENVDKSVSFISTGSFSLDKALGIGGVPRGRIIEIFGNESTGKSTLALTIVKQVQQAGGNAAYVDAENALDLDYAKKIGINIEELLLSQPDYGEQALSVAQHLIESEEVDVIVIDSVSSLTPRAEIEGEMSDSHIGLQARMMGQAMRKLSSVIRKTNTCVIFINQVRMNIGIKFGSPITTSGGKALKFYASVRIQLSRTGNIKQGEEYLGAKIKAKVVKNKVAPPFRIGEFFIYFDEGLSSSAEIIELADKHKILTKKGAWYSYKDENIGQGFEKTKQYLRENPKVLKEIVTQIKKILEG